MVIDFMNEKFWTQHVTEPTHEKGNCLDLVFSSSENLVISTENIGYLGSSDHQTNITKRRGPKRKESDSREEVPDWRWADMKTLKENLSKIDWEEEFNGKSGVESVDIFYDILDRETNKCVPKKLRRKRNKPIWMKGKILRMMSKKRRMWRFYSTRGAVTTTVS